MSMNLGELHRERDRLLAVLEEAKTCKPRLKQINILIAMYGDVGSGIDVDRLGMPIENPMTCPQCPGKTFRGQHGLTMHNQKQHGIPGKSRTAVKPGRSTQSPKVLRAAS